METPSSYALSAAHRCRRLHASSPTKQGSGSYNDDVPRCCEDFAVRQPIHQAPAAQLLPDGSVPVHHWPHRYAMSRRAAKSIFWSSLSGKMSLTQALSNDSDVRNLMDTCGKLRALSLTSCDTVTGAEYVLKIDAPRSDLVTLEFITCGFARVDLIHVPKLGRVVCDTWYDANPPLRLGIVPRLHNICISCSALCYQTPFALSELLASTRNLTILYLNFRDQMIWIEPEDPKHLSHVFGNLRDVYIYNIFYECDLNWTMFLLEAAPSLKNFYLMLSRHPCERSRCEDSAEKVNVLWDQASSGFKHQHLSILEIKGFVMDERLMKYIRHVMERAVHLKRIRLLDQDTCEKCDSMDNIQSSSSLIRWRFPTEEREKSLIRQQLVDGFSSSVDITIGG
uniref:Uncharacterized protein n=1 Tax=Avena sativa TaxID=4498 RepID=A0ACD5ZSC9_AVESA